uniref:Uncharacterized protein n=1 Tax=uncultured marine virus TaxID=186617 RepID=A0A0F7L2J6_9VIRU|nr:hypothetical protein [uncultured marine virus]
MISVFSLIIVFNPRILFFLILVIISVTYLTILFYPISIYSVYLDLTTTSAVHAHNSSTPLIRASLVGYS